ncbi:hypothetical protein [Nocardioides sp. SLBN-35]|uniref:hypothetical protein n=1 Tax=Nocardioides sp. SLBN-35 TaxID=2768445 RepID=UPI00114FA7E9|nr:hypothetical protein [Nocardioides sp. SLBN-35]TQK72090.1 hypothetical protein FBY23_3897 [Nocardioides sp. SLBN-35]
MSTEHDGLEEFEDSALVRALRAPGTPEELADEARFVAAFSAARPPVATSGHGGPGGLGGLGRGGRIVGRIGVGGAALLATVTLTGGMAAAAYTQHLPHSVQAIAHDAFGGVGVPPARPLTPTTRAPRATPTPTPSASESERPEDRRTPDASRSARPGERSSAGGDASVGTTGSATTDATGTTATGSPSGSGSPSATGSTGPTSPGTDDPATGTPTPPVTATSVGATTSVRRVVSGGRATVTGLVRDDGDLVEGAEVTLLERHAGGGWTRAGSAVTGQEGTAIFATGPLVETTTFRFQVEVDSDDDGEPDRVLLSRKRRIGVQPILTLTSTGSVVDAHAAGAGTGDAITISRRTADGRLVRIGIRRLDDQGNASYDLSELTGRVRVQVRVLRTSSHTAVQRWITVRVPRIPKTPPPTTPTPSTSPSGEPTGSAGSSTTTGS